MGEDREDRLPADTSGPIPRDVYDKYQREEHERIQFWLGEVQQAEVERDRLKAELEDLHEVAAAGERERHATAVARNRLREALERARRELDTRTPGRNCVLRALGIVEAALAGSVSDKDREPSHECCEGGLLIGKCMACPEFRSRSVSDKDQVCHEDMGSDPCGKPAVGERIDPDWGEPYPVCRQHLRPPFTVADAWTEEPDQEPCMFCQGTGRERMDPTLPCEHCNPKDQDA